MIHPFVLRQYLQVDNKHAPGLFKFDKFLCTAN